MAGIGGELRPKAEVFGWYEERSDGLLLSET